jgi:predicted RNA-binding protein with PIN domain
MIVIIDGYNLLKQVFPKIKGKLEKQRCQLVKQLGYYKSKKSEEIKEIILVFDGGQMLRATREIHKGIVVVFSGQISDADKWIFDYVKRHKGKQMLLVTQDRELKDNCKAYGADAIDVFSFYDIVQNAVLEDVAQKIKTSHDGVLQKIAETEDEAFDLLMAQYADSEYTKKNDMQYVKESRKSKAKKLSKKERALYKKIKKL